MAWCQIAMDCCCCCCCCCCCYCCCRTSGSNIFILQKASLMWIITSLRSRYMHETIAFKSSQMQLSRRQIRLFQLGKEELYEQLLPAGWFFAAQKMVKMSISDPDGKCIPCSPDPIDGIVVVVVDWFSTGMCNLVSSDTGVPESGIGLHWPASSFVVMWDCGEKLCGTIAPTSSSPLFCILDFNE